jgi:H+/Cl- antiporter ClcA
LLVFELTNDYLLILPIMMTSIVCVFTLRLLKMVWLLSPCPRA